MTGNTRHSIDIAITADDVRKYPPADLTIVIDVLRASSVIVTALAHDTPGIFPVAGIDEAMELKAAIPEALLAGERNTLKIKGFDRGNSPLEFIEPDEKHRSLILTTTNGTKTLNNIEGEGEIQIASFLNISVVADYMNQFSGNILLACSGTNGKFSLDDFLCAGGLISRLDHGSYITDDMGLMARRVYESTMGDFHDLLSGCHHYQVLETSGHGADLDFCIREDIFPILAEAVNTENGKLLISQKK